MIVHVDKLGARSQIQVRCNTCRDPETELEGKSLFEGDNSAGNRGFAEGAALFHDELRQGRCLVTVSLISLLN